MYPTFLACSLFSRDFVENISFSKDGRFAGTVVQLGNTTGREIIAHNTLDIDDQTLPLPVERNGNAF